MKSKKIMIMGGAGYVGSVLSPFLQKKGYEIVVADACWFGNNLPKEIQLIQTDLFELTKDDLKSFESIIFLAGLSNDPMAEYSPKSNFILNTALPAYIGFQAREAGVKQMVYASSCSVYGYTQNKTYTEKDPVISNYPYGVSKLQGERALMALVEENFHVTCVRQGTVCGYSPRMRLDLAMNTMFKNALQQQEIKLSNSKIWRPLLGMKDLCQAYHLILQNQPKGGNIYNISSFNTTVGQLADNITDFLKKHLKLEIKITDEKVQDYRNYKVSTDLATQHFNFKPQQNDLDIILDLFHHLDEFYSFNDDKFYNIKIFKKLIEENNFLLA